MIIRQRQTFLDPLLLKLVFPLLYAGNSGILRFLAGFWSDVLTTERVAAMTVEPKPKARNDRQEWWPRILRGLPRWARPWAPVPIAVERPSRRLRNRETRL